MYSIIHNLTWLNLLLHIPEETPPHSPLTANSKCLKRGKEVPVNKLLNPNNLKTLKTAALPYIRTITCNLSTLVSTTVFRCARIN